MGSNDRSNSQRKGWGASAQPPPACTTSANLNISVIPTSTEPSMTPTEPVATVPTDATQIAASHSRDQPATAELTRHHQSVISRLIASTSLLLAFRLYRMQA